MLTIQDLPFLWSHHLFQWMLHWELLNTSKVECNSARSPKPGIYDKSPTCTDYYCLHVLIRTISATEAAENVFCVCIAWYKNERGSRQVCKTRDEVKRLHNCQEFSQPLECLYQAMQTQEKSFLLLLQNYFSEKKTKLFEREILTSCKVLYTKFCMHNQFLFCEKDAFKNMDFSCLKCQQKKNDIACLYKRFFKLQPTRKKGKQSKLVQFSPQNLFQIHACVISAWKAKHLDISTVFA